MIDPNRLNQMLQEVLTPYAQAMHRLNDNIIRIDARLTTVETELAQLKAKLATPEAVQSAKAALTEVTEISFHSIMIKAKERNAPPYHAIITTIPYENTTLEWVDYPSGRPDKPVGQSLMEVYNQLNQFTTMSLDQFKSTIRQAFYLQGEAGTGKTQLVVSFMRIMSRQGYRCLFIQPKDIFYGFDCVSSTEIVEFICQYHIIVMDDFNFSHRGHEASLMFKLIMALHARVGFVMIITSNKDAQTYFSLVSGFDSSSRDDQDRFNRRFGELFQDRFFTC